MTDTRTPNASDRAEAERFIRDEYEADPAICRQWLANQRENITRQAAVCAMQKRQDAEWRALGEKIRKVRKEAA